MTRLELAVAAVEGLEKLIFAHTLPADTKARIRR
jgi:hypothetical protein